MAWRPRSSALCPVPVRLVEARSFQGRPSGQHLARGQHGPERVVSLGQLRGEVPDGVADERTLGRRRLPSAGGNSTVSRLVSRS
jgi:hypothetical protein